VLDAFWRTTVNDVVGDLLVYPALSEYAANFIILAIRRLTFLGHPMLDITISELSFYDFLIDFLRAHY